MSRTRRRTRPRAGGLVVGSRRLVGRAIAVPVRRRDQRVLHGAERGRGIGLEQLRHDPGISPPDHEVPDIVLSGTSFLADLGPEVPTSPWSASSPQLEEGTADGARRLSATITAANVTSTYEAVMRARRPKPRGSHRRNGVIALGRS